MAYYFEYTITNTGNAIEDTSTSYVPIVENVKEGVIEILYDERSVATDFQ